MTRRWTLSRGLGLSNADDLRGDVAERGECSDPFDHLSPFFVSLFIVVHPNLHLVHPDNPN
jgi:hypothetical protein